MGPLVAPAGVLLGADSDGRPVWMTLLRPAPTRVTVLGGLSLAREVALRALATGTRVVVVTGRPAAWQAVRRAAGSDVDRVVLRPDPLSAVDPDLPDGEPLLVVGDRGAAPSDPAVGRGAWRTTMVVLPALVPAVAEVADEADLVLLTRMPPHEAELAGRLWRLPDAMTETLRTLPEQGLVALGADLWRRVDRVTAPREAAILGPVRLGD